MRRDKAMDGIELIDLHKHYRQGATVVRALDGVSLRIDSGDFVSVVGRSGSGKTTLLDLMGLLLQPSSGTVRLDGVDTARLSGRRRADLRGRRIGFVFQEYNLLPSLSVLENVTLPLRYVRGSGREGHRRTLRLLELVGLADRAHTRPLQLSGGQQQRVAIARALVMSPALVLADEPLSTPGGSIAPTGKQITLRQVFVHRIEDGRIASEHVYLDHSNSSPSSAWLARRACRGSFLAGTRTVARSTGSISHITTRSVEDRNVCNSKR